MQITFIYRATILLLLTTSGFLYLPAQALELPSARVETRIAPGAEEMARPTQVVVLGTGTPIPDAHRAGPSIAIIHKGEAYLFDVGAGAIRNATIARYRYDIPALYPSQICCLFLSHLHSDHTMDIAELAYTLWWRRRAGLKVWGPKNSNKLIEGLTLMMSTDTDIREGGNQPLPNPNGYLVANTRIKEGIIFEKDDLTIEAFLVNHGDVKPAYGFRVNTADKSIVISGDTAYSDVLAEKARNVDLLFHEVISEQGLSKNTPFWQNYHNRAHTSSLSLAGLANKSKPKLLVLYHGLFYGTREEEVLQEVRSVYDGEVVLAQDLDIY